MSVEEQPVVLVDLAAQHREVAADVSAGWDSVLSRTAFVGGPEVTAFEAAYAEFTGVQHCIGVANGTDALELALRGTGIGPGDEVVLPANSFVASAEAVARAGATPVLVDVDDDFLLVDPAKVAERLTSRTRAVMPVHLYGQAAPVEACVAAARSVGAVVVEDAAQSQGALRHGRPAGSLGEIAATSFYPGKNLGAYGDAGAVVTDDASLAARVRSLANHGSTSKYLHPDLGFNSRLDTLQAVVLSAKLARLATWNEARRTAARRYDAMLADVDGVRLPATLPGNEHVWHLYVVRVDQRDAVQERLNGNGIGAGVHYPVPIHLQGGFSFLGHRPGDFPVAERAAGEILSLPMHPHLSVSDQERVVDQLVKAVHNV
jgi:dTDP-4-amino-4,6-dideoxygalactose transaminase